jgi:hypothetical protein
MSDKEEIPTKPAISGEPLLAPVYCSGWRYNFKKGVEQCKNKSTCNAFRNYDKSDKPYDLNTIYFIYIKDFRKCDRWLNRC